MILELRILIAGWLKMQERLSPQGGGHGGPKEEP